MDTKYIPSLKVNDFQYWFNQITVTMSQVLAVPFTNNNRFWIRRQAF